MYCGKCGAHNPDTALFCYKCGADLSRFQSKQQKPAQASISRPDDPLAVTHPIQTDQKSTTPSVQGIIGNRYQISKELGRGGRGVVYEAFDRQLEIKVAIKFLPPELASDKRAVEELKTEAKAAMMLSHPHIVRLHNFEDMDGYKFLTMEYIDGPTLDDMLSRRKQFTVNETIKYAVQILTGLDYAHKKGVIHRDLKPANLMKTPEGIVKITDYGIASIISDSMKKVSNEFVIGTPRYMSPEQLLGKQLDNRSDLYSLGVVLYEFLTGEPPFSSGGLEYQIINTVPKPIENVSERLSYIILKILSKSPEDRWINAQQFSDALQGKIRITLPTEEEKKTSMIKRIVTTVQDLRGELKSRISDKKKRDRRAKLERRSRVFEKKQRLPGVKESEFFRHTIIGIWVAVFALLFPFNISVDKGNEALLLGSLFVQALILGILSYWKWLSSAAAMLLPWLAYYISFPQQELLVRSKGFLFVALLSLLNGLIALIITHFRVDAGYSSAEIWEKRDFFLLWIVIIGGLFIIPILEDHTDLGLTHNSILFYVLLLAVFVKRIYNGFLFPVITLSLFTISRRGFDGLIQSFTDSAKEIKTAREIILSGSYKTLIIELTIVAAILTLLLSLISMMIKDAKKLLRFSIRTAFLFLLVGTSLFVYQYWIAKDVYVGSKVYVESNTVTLGISIQEATNLSGLYSWNRDKFSPEYPEHLQSVEGFYIDRFEVTNRQYKEFMDATGAAAPEHWGGNEYPFLEDFKPVVGVTYQEAQAYTIWKQGRLPSEAEWILAARGNKKGLFPWGNNVNPSFLNSIILSEQSNCQETNRIETSVVGWFYTDISPFGCFDMAGNVMEWVTDKYSPYAGNPMANLEPDFKKKYHLVKGGSYNHPIFQCRITARYGVPENSKKLDVGFRCIYDVRAGSRKDEK